MAAQSTAVATVPEGRSVLIDMAVRFGMQPAAFEATLRATVVPKDCSKEQFAAFLLVAKEYDLNPLTKEIYAFPTKGGGIQPIVSIDGWANLINSHPALDGIEFDDHADESGQNLSAITARIWRKDRTKPIIVTEYMAECKRPTDPWKQWPRRMLRHKALIQCARYAFGFAGIVDPDEAERMADVSPMRDVSPVPAPPVPPEPPAVAEPSNVVPVDRDDAGDIPPMLDRRARQHAAAAIPSPSKDPDGFVKAMLAKLAAAKTMDELNEVWASYIEPAKGDLFPPDEADLSEAFGRAQRRIEPSND